MIRKKTPPHKTSSKPTPPKGQQAYFPPIGSTLTAYSPNGTAAVQPAAVTQPGPKAGWRHRVNKRNVKRTVLTVIALVLVITGFVGFKFFDNLLKTFKGNVFGLLHSTPLKGEDTGRVNILLAGNSSDDPGHSGGNLTDSIMIVSLDTKDNTAFMLSILRDMWVSIPGHGYAKINSVYPDGEADHFSQAGYPNGGMGLLEEVVEQDFGINLNYYALINYTAFRDAVNAVGGVDVTITSPDSRGLYDPNISITDGGPLRLSNGLHHLNGQQALNLARARGDSYYSYGFPQSDFNRTEHQRQLLVALKEKITSAGVIANPIALSNLFDSIGNNVQTDFQTSEVRRLYDLNKKIPASSIKSVGLNNVNGKNLLRSYTGYGGQSALVPAAGVSNYSAIQAYITQLLQVGTSSNTSSQ